MYHKKASRWAHRGPRTVFTPAERALVLQSAQFVCYVCGNPGADEVDHIIPLAEDGKHDLSNAGAIHNQPCHEEKSRQESERGYQRRIARLKLPLERHPFDME